MKGKRKNVIEDNGYDLDEERDEDCLEQDFLRGFIKGNSIINLKNFLPEPIPFEFLKEPFEKYKNFFVKKNNNRKEIYKGCSQDDPCDAGIWKGRIDEPQCAQGNDGLCGESGKAFNNNRDGDLLSLFGETIKVKSSHHISPDGCRQEIREKKSDEVGLKELHHGNDELEDL